MIKTEDQIAEQATAADDAADAAAVAAAPTSDNFAINQAYNRGYWARANEAQSVKDGICQNLDIRLECLRLATQGVMASNNPPDAIKRAMAFEEYVVTGGDREKPLPTLAERVEEALNLVASNLHS